MYFIKKITCIFLLVILVACNGTKADEIPPLFTMETNISGNHEFVNFNVDEIQILGQPGDPIGMGEFRLLVIGADTDGRSSGTYCPGNEPIKIQKGDTITSPCLFVVSFDESKVGDGVYLMLIVLDEDESSLPADLSYELVANQLGQALGKAVAKGILGVASKSNPYSIAAQVLVSFLGGKVKNWFEKADMVGAQGIYLSRDDSWSAGKQRILTSGDGGIQIKYTVTRSSSGPTKTNGGTGEGIALPTQIPSPTSPLRATAKDSAPEEFVRSYFYAVTHDRNYEYTWSLLTTGFQNKNAPNGYSEYVKYWDRIKSVEINSINFYENTNTSAKCSVNLTFTGQHSGVETVDVKYHLIYDSSRDTWLFESP